jgi:hypothetical protein
VRVRGHLQPGRAETSCDPGDVRYDNDPWWSALVTTLQTVGAVKDREPSGLVVTRESPPTAVEIVMTPQEWDDLVSMMWGTDEPAVRDAAQHVCQLLLHQPPHHDYLVYSQYVLVPCETAEIPPDPDLVRMQELAAQYPDGVIPGGYWSAHPPDDDARA